MVLPGRGEGKTIKQVEQEGIGKPSIKWSKGEGKTLKSERGREGGENPKKQAR
jgi:hypothetical protein